MGKLDDDLDSLVKLGGSGAGWGAPEAYEQHLLEIEHVKFKITRRDSMRIAVVSALIGAVVGSGATLLSQVLG